jgi:hypothetical protein
LAFSAKCFVPTLLVEIGGISEDEAVPMVEDWPGDTLNEVFVWASAALDLPNWVW